jgi:hypothetical protein
MPGDDLPDHFRISKWRIECKEAGQLLTQVILPARKEKYAIGGTNCIDMPGRPVATFASNGME